MYTLTHMLVRIQRIEISNPGGEHEINSGINVPEMLENFASDSWSFD